MVKDWDRFHDDIRKLYHVENNPLREVMRIIKGKHGFQASERSYRTQLQKWGYLKYRTESNPSPMGSNKKGKKAKRHIPIAATSSNLSASTRGPSTSSSFHPNIPAFSFYDNNANGGLFEANAPTLVANSVSQFNLAFDQGLPQTDLAAPFQYSVGMNEQDDEGKTRLHRAVTNKAVEQVKYLLSVGAAVDISDQREYEPLHYAVMAKEQEIVQLLLRFGADVDARGPLGRTPLHLAVLSQNIVEDLLREGASVAIQDENGDTALHLALSLSPPVTVQHHTNGLMQLPTTHMDSVIDALMNRKPNLNLPNNKGNTAFHLLLYRPYPTTSSPVATRLIRFLNEGASVTLTAADGRSPFQIFLTRCEVFRWADRSNRWMASNSLNEVFRIFIAKGANPL